MNGGWGITYKIALRWMPLDLPDDKSTLVQVMAWCRQATSHYLSQCWPRPISPYGFTWPQWVNVLTRALFTNPPWISNHMHSQLWDKITHPFPHFTPTAALFEVWEWKVISSNTSWWCNYRVNTRFPLSFSLFPPPGFLPVINALTDPCIK